MAREGRRPHARRSSSHRSSIRSERSIATTSTRRLMKEFSLAVDGSTYAGTVAVMRGHEVVAERSLPDSGIPARGQRGEDFMPMVVECMAEAGVTVGDLERIICGAGP